MNIELNFKSPIIVGSQKLKSNIIESDTVIKGSVVRAAFANEILRNCVEFNDDEYNDGDIKRKNWVYFRDKAGCTSCSYKSICQNFSNLKFSYFYPKGAEVIPLSSLICKNDDKHGFVDILVDDISKGCKICGQDSRVEFTSGLRSSSGDIKRLYKVKKSISTKCGINPYSKTSYDGKLYSLISLTATDPENNSLIFTGTIDGITKEDLENIDTLRVGAYTSVGYGKCTMEIKQEKEDKLTIDDVKNFSKRFKENNQIHNKNNYIAIKFTGDCKLNFDFDEEEYIPTNEIKKIWERALELEENISIEKVYTEIVNYRGYDSSLLSEDKREESINLAQRGTVIVFSTDKDIKELYDYLFFKKAFGLETENGFGAFEIYIGR